MPAELPPPELGASQTEKIIDLTVLDRQPWSGLALVNSLLTGLAGLCLGLTLVPLGLLLGFVLVRGGARLNLALLTQLPPAPGFSGGGIANAIWGTVLVCGLATAFALPLGVWAAVYLTEFSKGSRLAGGVRFAANVLSGVPAIMAGVFVYGLLVQTGLTGFSAVAGGGGVGGGDGADDCAHRRRCPAAGAR